MTRRLSSTDLKTLAGRSRKRRSKVASWWTKCWTTRTWWSRRRFPCQSGFSLRSPCYPPSSSSGTNVYLFINSVLSLILSTRSGNFNLNLNCNQLLINLFSCLICCCKKCCCKKKKKEKEKKGEFLCIWRCPSRYIQTVVKIIRCYNIDSPIAASRYIPDTYCKCRKYTGIRPSELALSVPNWSHSMIKSPHFKQMQKNSAILAGGPPRSNGLGPL